MDKDAFIELDLPSMPIPDRQQALTSAVAPRPIALVGSLDAEGRPNLAPFSFFNAFGGNPAMIAVSPANSGKTGQPKHTFLNIQATKEFTISVVSHAMVDQVNLASCSFAAGVDEFIKAGFTKKPSRKIAAPGVLESPCILECRLVQYVELGGKPGSGNLLIAEVVHLHVKRNVLDAQGRMDPAKIDQVSRLGYEWYSRTRDGLFQLAKPPVVGEWIGVDRLPRGLRESEVLTGSDLARLASVERVPDSSWASAEGRFQEVLSRSEREFHLLIQQAIRAGQFDYAWQAVLFYRNQFGEG